MATLIHKLRRYSSIYLARKNTYTTWQAADLMTAIAMRKDRAAFAELYHRFLPKAISVARLVTRNQEDAADAVQEAMTRVWLSAPSFHGQGRLDAWLRKIVIRESIKRAQLKHKRRLVRDLDSNQLASKGSSGPQHYVSEVDDVRTRLRSLVDELPREDGEVLALYFEEGCSQDVIASRLAISQRTVSYRLKGILRRLRVSLGTKE